MLLALLGIGIDCFKSLQQRPLRLIDLDKGHSEVEPLCAVNLRKCLSPPTAWRPFNLESVAGDIFHIDIALDGKCLNRFAAALANFT